MRHELLVHEWMCKDFWKNVFSKQADMEANRTRKPAHPFIYIDILNIDTVHLYIHLSLLIVERNAAQTSDVWAYLTDACMS